jgi:hypothetical protein
MRPALIVAALVIVAGCTALPATTEPLPSGGLTADEAVHIAAADVPFTDVVAARPGPFWSVMGASSRPPGPSIEDQWVWAVTFAGDVTLRDPTTGVLLSQQPGTSTIYLDYFTGAFIEASNDTATPSPTR